MKCRGTNVGLGPFEIFIVGGFAQGLAARGREIRKRAGDETKRVGAQVSEWGMGGGRKSDQRERRTCGVRRRAPGNRAGYEGVAREGPAGPTK